MELAHDQRKFLKSVRKKNFTRNDLTDKEESMYDDLYKDNYLKYEHIYDNESDRVPSKSYIRVTEKGLLAIERDEKEILMWFIPVILSIISIVVSIIAIYKSSAPLSVYIYTSNAIIATITAIVAA